jgi:peptidoglycan hydrolase-like protein with peptidoglycan-binding domain
VVLIAAAAGAVAAVGYGGEDEEASGRSGVPAATAVITRTTLTRTETVAGTLGYGDETTVKARAGGTVTWLPGPGKVIGQGRPVYRADGRPVVLLHGSAPLYRTLHSGLTGADVALLERNLDALGYDGFTVDRDYTGATADAVRRWQDDLGLPENGRVEPERVVVMPGAVRVSARRLALGDPASGAVLTCTGTTRMITVHLDVARQHLVREGLPATVELPDGKQVRGKVDSVGTVATEGEESTTVDVVVSVADQKKLGTLDRAPVDVKLRAEERPDVLTVPVAALVALAEGGYGVRVVDGTTTRYVAVDTGMFAGGRVEITGSGLTEGLAVGVPA